MEELSKRVCTECEGMGIMSFNQSLPNWAVLCSVCNGKGFVLLPDVQSELLFNGLRRKAGVQFVCKQTTGCGRGQQPRGKGGIAYKNFLAGKMPK